MVIPKHEMPLKNAYSKSVGNVCKLITLSQEVLEQRTTNKKNNY